MNLRTKEKLQKQFYLMLQQEVYVEEIMGYLGCGARCSQLTGESFGIRWRFEDVDDFLWVRNNTKVLAF